MSDTPTPETDDFIREFDPIPCWQWEGYSRRLERERDAARKQVADLLDILSSTTANDWTKYDGGPMPCSPSLAIRVKYRCGEESSVDRADYYLWNQTGEAYDIMEWREA